MAHFTSLHFSARNKRTSRERGTTAVVCVAVQKIEVDPVKFAAELESYEDLKRRLVVDAALFGAVGAFATFQVRRLVVTGKVPQMISTQHRTSSRSKQRADNVPFEKRHCG